MKQDWETKKLNEVCKLITCGVAARPQYVDEGIPFLSAKNVKDGQIIWSGFNCVSEQTHKELTKNNKPLLGDILYTRVGSYGEAAVIEDDYEFSVFVSLTLIKVDKKVLNNYFLKHFLNSDSVKRLAKKSISSSGVGNLNVGTVREFPIALPPLPEQQRIVAILDEAFAAIAKAKANAEQNLKNAKELFESYLQSVFENKGEGWEEKTLSELFDVKHGFAFLGEFFSDSGDYVLLTPGNFFEKGGYRDRGDKQKYYIGNIPPDFILKEGDLLVAMTEQAAGLLGSPIIVPESNKFLHNQRLGLVRPKSDIQFDNEFFYHVLNLKHVRKSLHDSGTGVKVRHTSPTKIGQVVICYPKSKTEQQNIVQKLDALSAQTKKLEAIYQQHINDLEELKKSILQKAFNGELNTEKSRRDTMIIAMQKAGNPNPEGVK
jgi:type I restriction enzyme, S subunit